VGRWSSSRTTATQHGTASQQRALRRLRSSTACLDACPDRDGSHTACG
jgi:hypothetical protein